MAGCHHEHAELRFFSALRATAAVETRRRSAISRHHARHAHMAIFRPFTLAARKKRKMGHFAAASASHHRARAAAPPAQCGQHLLAALMMLKAARASPVARRATIFDARKDTPISGRRAARRLLFSFGFHFGRPTSARAAEVLYSRRRSTCRRAAAMTATSRRRYADAAISCYMARTGMLAARRHATAALSSSRSVR